MLAVDWRYRKVKIMESRDMCDQIFEFSDLLVIFINSTPFNLKVRRPYCKFYPLHEQNLAVFSTIWHLESSIYNSVSYNDRDNLLKRAIKDSLTGIIFLILLFLSNAVHLHFYPVWCWISCLSTNHPLPLLSYSLPSRRRWLQVISITPRDSAKAATRRWSTSRRSTSTPTALYSRSSPAGSSTTSWSSPPRSSWDRSASSGCDTLCFVVVVCL